MEVMNILGNLLRPHIDNDPGMVVAPPPITIPTSIQLNLDEFNAAVNELKMLNMEEESLKDIQLALNKIFPNSECISVINTKNTDNMFVGVS